MKDLTHYKKQVRESRRLKTHARAHEVIDAIGQRILDDSNKRWDAMLAALKLQRRNLRQRRINRVHPKIAGFLKMLHVIDSGPHIVPMRTAHPHPLNVSDLI